MRPFNRCESGAQKSVDERTQRKFGRAGPGVFGAISLARGSQASNTFSTRPPGPTTASHRHPPLLHQLFAAGSFGASGLGRTLRKSGVVSSREFEPPRHQGQRRLVPGQCVADFSDRRRSARRSDSRRSRSVAPWSTKDMASAMARWPGDLGDGAVHLLCHPPVGRVALRPGAQFDEVHGLAGVEMHDVTDAMSQRDRVRRLFGKVRQQGAVEVLGPVRWFRRSARRAPPRRPGRACRSRARCRGAAIRWSACDAAAGRGTRRSR